MPDTLTTAHKWSTPPRLHALPVVGVLAGSVMGQDKKDERPVKEERKEDKKQAEVEWAWEVAIDLLKAIQSQQDPQMYRRLTSESQSPHCASGVTV